MSWTSLKLKLRKTIVWHAVYAKTNLIFVLYFRRGAVHHKPNSQHDIEENALFCRSNNRKTSLGAIETNHLSSNTVIWSHSCKVSTCGWVIFKCESGNTSALVPLARCPFTWRSCLGWKLYPHAWNHLPRQSTPLPWSCTPRCLDPTSSNHMIHSQFASLQTAKKNR